MSNNHASPSSPVMDSPSNVDGLILLNSPCNEPQIPQHIKENCYDHYSIFPFLSKVFLMILYCGSTLLLVYALYVHHNFSKWKRNLTLLFFRGGSLTPKWMSPYITWLFTIEEVFDLCRSISIYRYILWNYNCTIWY
jgi:hypothetical protein